TRIDTHPALRLTDSKEQKDIPLIRSFTGEEIVLTDSVDYRGVPVLAVTRYIEETDWGLVAKVDKNEAFAPLTKMRDILAFILVVFSILIILVSFFLSSTITRPIVRLTNSARRISKGDLTIQADESSSDELGFLGLTFNLMTANLIHAKNEIEDNIQELQKEIIERKLSEEALRVERDRLISVFEAMDDGVYIVNQDYDIEYVNPALTADFGPPDGRKCYDYFHDRKAVCPWCTNRDVFAGRTVHWEWYSPRNDRTYDLIDTPLRNADGTISKLEIFRDITDRKQAEEELRKHRDHFEELVKERTRELTTANEQLRQEITERKRAEEARERLNAQLRAKNTELEQIVYVTSHDLRSPLVNVQGFSKELEIAFREVASAIESEGVPSEVKERLTPLLEEDIPEAVRFILTSISKMDALLSGLLRLSRLGRVALTIEELDMNSLMSDIAAASEFQIKEQGVTLDIGELPPYKGDKAQITQVFSNLLDNALKYLDPGRSGIIHIAGRKKQEKVIYCVEDNGIGIAQTHQEKIFEIFQRFDPNIASGEGLGLTIVRRILDRCHGKIWVESEPGKGSRFFVALPAVSS
ncbi:MAG: ATP-binding protein, partial [Anaerolineales bacterium]